jgi:hypothetical protein
MDGNFDISWSGSGGGHWRFLALADFRVRLPLVVAGCCNNPICGSITSKPGVLPTAWTRYIHSNITIVERPRVRTLSREGYCSPMIIKCSKLTTCNALNEGEAMKLDFIDTGGNPVALLLPFEHAESIAMTLPRLLTNAVKKQTGRENARYVFPLGQWLLEGTDDQDSFILTMKTVDGFEVSFRIPHDTCVALGWTLQHEANVVLEANEAPKIAVRGTRSGTAEFN